MCLYVLASQTYSLIYMIICNMYDYILDNIFLYFKINGLYCLMLCTIYKYATYVCVYIK